PRTLRLTPAAFRVIVAFAATVDAFHVCESESDATLSAAGTAAQRGTSTTGDSTRSTLANKALAGRALCCRSPGVGAGAAGCGDSTGRGRGRVAGAGPVPAAACHGAGQQRQAVIDAHGGGLAGVPPAAEI